MSDYLKLAQEQFLNLKEEELDLNRKILGSQDETNYEKDGIKFKISVDGFWEKATWFNYTVSDEQGNIIEKDTYIF